MSTTMDLEQELLLSNGTCLVIKHSPVVEAAALMLEWEDKDILMLINLKMKMSLELAASIKI